MEWPRESTNRKKRRKENPPKYFSGGKDEIGKGELKTTIKGIERLFHSQ